MWPTRETLYPDTIRTCWKLIRCCKWRRIMVFLTIVGTMIMLNKKPDDTSEVHTLQILNAIGRITTNVVLPNESTTLVEPSRDNECQDEGSRQYMLFMIISAPENKENRNVIREVLRENVLEWDDLVVKENKEYNRGESIKALFFTGVPTNGAASLQDMKEEGHMHGDMIIDNFEESYLNLTVKTLRLLKWVRAKCPNVRYLAKQDDDVHVNVPVLLNVLNSYNYTTGKYLMGGHKYNSILPDSDPYSKWYTPEALWQGRLPNFVAGFFYILGRNARTTLYKHALESPLFHLEDVFLTGIVRENVLNVDVVDIPEIHTRWVFSNQLGATCTFRQTVVAIHSLSPSKLRCYGLKAREFCNFSWPLYFYC